ncbi:hypothetical protein F4861DRAFT_544485 [Xylaria intraflava]|nr:hypothetical protein F4861DRAFT_544485 [Xylaria intraflava]
MDMRNFINPPEENVINSSEDLVSHVAQIFSQVPDEEEEEKALPLISLSDALKSVNLLIEFEGQQENLISLRP